MNSPKLVKLTIDGIEVSVPEGTSIWDAARQAGIDIPVLCHSPRLRPVGVCRMCVVDIGQRVMAASCVRTCEDGMKVDASSEKVQKHRKTLTQLLLSDYPNQSQRELKTGDDQLLALDAAISCSRSHAVSASAKFPFRMARSRLDAAATSRRR